MREENSGLFVFIQVEHERKKKEEGKRARADKQKVLEMLFSAFEKHQYYNIRDLVDITKQPVVSSAECKAHKTTRNTFLISRVENLLVCVQVGRSWGSFAVLLCVCTLYN